MTRFVSLLVFSFRKLLVHDQLMKKSKVLIGSVGNQLQTIWNEPMLVTGTRYQQFIDGISISFVGKYRLTWAERNWPRLKMLEQFKWWNSCYYKSLQTPFKGQAALLQLKDFLSKCDQIRSFLRIWSHLLKKSLMKNFIFCAV